MNDRLAKLERMVEELRAENQELRCELQEMREHLAMAERGMPSPPSAPPSRRRVLIRWAIPLVTIFLVVVPVVAMTAMHLDAFWSTVIGALNALFVYFIGPGAVRLMAEGLVRAIPGIVLGQTTRIAVDSMRRKKVK